MTIASKNIMAAALAAPLALCVPAAAAGTAPDALEAQIKALQQQLTSVQGQLDALKQAQTEQTDAAKQQAEEIGNRIAITEKKQKGAATATLKAGRPSFSSPDGDFTASIRANVQIDSGYYMQNAAGRSRATGPDLSSGINIRRAQLGIEGTLFEDWTYKFNYEFGGSAYESGGNILNAYLQYDGLKPLAIRIGAFSPPFSIEDQTASSALMFLERNSPTNMVRSVAGGDNRLGISLIYASPRLFGSLSYTASKIGESGSYDEQSAAVARLAYLAVNDTEHDAHLVIGAGGIHVFELPDLLSAESGAKMHTLTLSDYPEITVDDTAAKLMTTGAQTADHFTAWQFETAGNYKNFYLQAAYHGIEVNRARATYSSYSASGIYDSITVQPRNDSYYSWYVQGSWVITGESKPYLPATAAFGMPKPARPFSLENGSWGAFELAARYSDTNLNAHMEDDTSVITAWSGSSKTYTFVNAVGGGEQQVYTLGLNWYPNSSLRFVFDYMWIDVGRRATTAASSTMPHADIGQSLQAVALRTQIAF